MIQVRGGVFETNSSSTHSICIQKKPVDADYSYIVFNTGEYGWDEREVNLGDYLYTAILCLDPDGKKGYLSKLKSILDAHSIRYEFEWPEYDERWHCYEDCYIDHCYRMRICCSGVCLVMIASYILATTMSVGTRIACVPLQTNVHGSKMQTANGGQRR